MNYSGGGAMSARAAANVAAKARQMGANVYLSPMSMEGVGRFSVIADPQGAVFAIFKSAR